MEPESPTASVTKLSFRRPSFWSNWVIFVVVACAMAVASLARMETRNPSDVITVVVMLAITAIVVIWRKVRLPAVTPPIELSETQFVLPRSVDSRRSVTIDYRELRALSLRQRGATQLLVIETTQGLFMFPSLAFAEPNGVERFLVALRERIGALPQSSEVMDRMARREEQVRRVLNLRPVATYGILATLACGLAAQVFTHAIADDGDIMRITALGANVPALVRSGELWRLVSASFLHSGFFHVFINGLMLIMIGQIVERVIGPWRMVTVYVAACIGGAGLSAMASVAGASVGASTGIFGLLGALAVCNWHYRRELAFGFKQPTELWVFNILLNAALPFFIPYIDVWGHIGGFATGALATYLLIVRDSELVYARPAGLPTQVIATIAGTLVLVAAIFAARSAVTLTPQKIVAVARSSGEPSWMNSVAWEVARDAHADAQLVAGALDVAAAAVGVCKADEDCNAYRDTYATLLYRQARYDEALDAEDKALREATKVTETYQRPFDSAPSAQLGRFLDARFKKLGVRSSGIDAADVSVDMVGQGLRVQLMREAPKGVMLYGLLKQGSAREGLIRVTLGADRAREREHVIPLKSAVVHGVEQLKSPQSLDIVAAWIDANDCRCDAAAYEVRLWPHDTSVDGYP
jgi:rhomboid protease GluP